MGPRLERTRFRFWHWLIRIVGVIVPRRLRADWRQEWEAELRHRELLLADWDKLNRKAKLDLVRRSLGALRDALLLQPSRWEDEILRDFRYGARMLLKHKGFTAVAIVTLTLGIGANTAIFSVVNGVLLKSLPFPESERLVTITETSKEVPVLSVAFPNYLDWRAQQTVFEDLAAWRPAGGVITGGPEPLRVIGRFVSASLFSILGVQPHSGRFFTKDEDKPGAERVMVLSYGLWRGRFGGDPGLIGKPISYNGESWTVIGVTPANFDFYGQGNLNNDFFIPLGGIADQRFMQNRSSHPVWVMARMKPGIRLEQAQREMKSIAGRLEAEYPVSNTGNSVAIKSFLDDYVGEVREPLFVIAAAVVLVLLIACANVANLLLARSALRRKEIAIRVAMGAGRLAIVRQLLVESLMLAFISGALGLLLAGWGVRFLITLIPDGVPRTEDITIDPQVLAFTMLTTLLTGILFGLAPAIQSSKVDLHDALKEGGGRESSGTAGQRLRAALVVSEVAFSLVLLVGAGLLLKSFRQLMEADPGFDAQNVLTLRLRLPDAKYRDATQSTSFLKEVTRRITGLPGVNQVSLGTSFPLGGRAAENGYLMEGQPEPQKPGDWAVANTLSVNESFHETLGITLLAGRYISAQDIADSPSVILVDDHFVRRHFPSGDLKDAIGKRMRFGANDEPWREIVGVVRHVRQVDLAQEGFAQIYVPWTQMSSLADFARVMDLIIKTSVEPLSLVASIKEEVQAVDKDQPLGNVRSLEAIVAQNLAPRRFNLLLFVVFACIALLLGAVGLYGVIAYTVTQRTREIGIRMALGAQKRDVLRLVFREGLALSSIGVLIGVASSLALTRLMKSLLYNVSATDPPTLITISLLMTAIALAACYVPARRAMKVDPLVAVRHE
ncbi:MAG TPA: ABC transporter permease [Blastocatellia bacterium]|nr:ABC transporter permease [Blastocatellia bacterium]